MQPSRAESVTASAKHLARQGKARQGNNDKDELEMELAVECAQGLAVQYHLRPHHTWRTLL